MHIAPISFVICRITIMIMKVVCALIGGESGSPSPSFPWGTSLKGNTPDISAKITAQRMQKCHSTSRILPECFVSFFLLKRRLAGIKVFLFLSILVSAVVRDRQLTIILSESEPGRVRQKFHYQNVSPTSVVKNHLSWDILKTSPSFWMANNCKLRPILSMSAKLAILEKFDLE